MYSAHYFSDVKETCIFLTDFGKNTYMSSVMKICPVGAKLLHMEGQTDILDEANSGFSQLSERVQKPINISRTKRVFVLENHEQNISVFN
jgi:hypothetical protein